MHFYLFLLEVEDTCNSDQFQGPIVVSLYLMLSLFDGILLCRQQTCSNRMKVCQVGH